MTGLLKTVALLYMMAGTLVGEANDPRGYISKTVAG